MKITLRLLLACILSLPLSTRAADEQDASGRKGVTEGITTAGGRSDFDETTRLIFHSVLEGLYEDGISNEDVDQILMRKEKQCYFHFIYACPVCNATIWALEAYRGRPERFYGMKFPGSTFGPGLSKAMHERLYSNDAQVRLGVVNELVKGWLERRLKLMNLSPAAHANVIASLEKKRKQGMEALQSFRRGEHGPGFSVEQAAPAYVDIEECAVCNAAVGKQMKLPPAKRK